MNDEDNSILESLLRKWGRRDRNVAKKRDDRTKKSSGTGLRLSGILKRQKPEPVQNASQELPTERRIPKPLHDFILPPTIPQDSQNLIGEEESTQQGLEREMENVLREDPLMNDNEESNQARSKTYQEKQDENYEVWDERMIDFYEAFVTGHSFAPSHCSNCQRALYSFLVDCTSCRTKLCHMCDEKFHEKIPFHHRILLKRDPSQCKKLMSTEFVDFNGLCFSKGKQEMKTHIKPYIELLIIFPLYLSRRCSSM